MSEASPTSNVRLAAKTYPSAGQDAPREPAIAHTSCNTYNSHPEMESETEKQEYIAPEIAGEDWTDPNHPEYGQRDEFGRELPRWHETLTIRALVLSAVIGLVFNLMVLKLGFTVGIVPSLPIAAALLGYAGGKLWFFIFLGIQRGIRACTGYDPKWMESMRTPFTRQENTVIQTATTICYMLSFAGGFTNSLIALDWNTYLKVEGGLAQFPNGTVPDSAYGHPPEQLPKNVVQPGYLKYVAFMAVIYFVGIFLLIPLRKIFITRYRLVYPTGAATGHLVNKMNTPFGARAAKKQLWKLGKWSLLSFIYSGLKWCFSGPFENCGMSSLPTFGYKAKKWTWYDPFSATYIGVGLLLPKHITYGLVFGAVLTQGIMWPLINDHKAGIWFDKKFGQGNSDIRGIYAYKVFTGLGFILGDGAYNLALLIFTTVYHLFRRHVLKKEVETGPDPILPGTFDEEEIAKQLQRLENLRDRVFCNGAMPTWAAISCYVVLAAIPIGVVPQLFAGVKAYHIGVAYVLAPVLGFCNAYGCGLSDWNMVTTYGKLSIVIFAAWAGSGGGVVAGLACGCVMQALVSQCADLMQDFRTAHLTLTHPRSMLIAQITGALLAVFITPAAFWLYWSAFNIGAPHGEYKAPFASAFRSMAVVLANGSHDLPKHCLAIAGGAFGAAILMNIARDLLAWKYNRNSIYVKLIPIPAVIGIPSFIGAYFTLDMGIGAIILAIWQAFNPADAKASAPVVASALIAGDGVWTIPAAILALAKVSPPMCAQFFSSSYYSENIAELAESA